MRKVVLDIETDGLDAKTIHLVVFKQIGRSAYDIFGGPNGYPMAMLVPYLMKADKIIMHNGVSFDLPVINSLITSFMLFFESARSTLSAFFDCFST